MLQTIIGGSLIFFLRLGDVPISTVRTMLMVQGRRVPVAILAVCESAIWVFAISRLLKGDVFQDPAKIIGYAVGFATGTIVGMTIEEWLAFGKVMVRVISGNSMKLREKLHETGFGVTAVKAEGKEGEVYILFVVALRRRERQLLRAIQSVDPHAFITVEQVGEAIGGYLRQPASATGGH